MHEGAFLGLIITTGRALLLEPIDPPPHLTWTVQGLRPCLTRGSAMTVSVIFPPVLTLDGVDDVPRAWEGQRAVAVNHRQEGPKEDERRES